MRTNDGLELTGVTPPAIVAELRALSDNPTPSDYEFMARTAGRVSRETGQRVRCDNAEHFVADLTSAGFLLDE